MNIELLTFTDQNNNEAIVIKQQITYVHQVVNRPAFRAIHTSASNALIVKETLKEIKDAINKTATNNPTNDFVK